MPRKKSIKEKSLLHQERTDLLIFIKELRWSGVTPSGATKSWMTISKRCSTSKQTHIYPQLTELTIDYTYPEPLLGESMNNWIRVVTKESTTIDPFDARNRIMKFNHVTRYDDYAVSSQGAFVEFKHHDGLFTVKNICKTRAVPSSTNVKYFKEYLLESDDGDMLLVFLIYRKSLSLVDEIEVLKLDYEKFELVKVNRLHGTALFLEPGYGLSVDARTYGCRDDCIFINDGLENDKWRIYEMESGSFSQDCSRSPKSTWGPRVQE